MNQMNDRRADTVGTLRISREVLSTIAGNRGFRGCRSTQPYRCSGRSQGDVFQTPASEIGGGDPAGRHCRGGVGTWILNGEVKIPIVSEKVQRAVKDAIQSMTRVTVSKVHVVIEGINFSAAAAAV